ncbi:four-carbon acid sugar kinase family protein [Alteribacter populi]|uniref:four-carbon acid sugar kinase family protein n=1 Tax=Alteribacter populi TaxID=2011011 RepID=UPI000BBAE875|nr:four-carbon acid sugar kinase family protein [Alteribacter populi]
MNFTIIADDLTGACDTGFQLVPYAMQPSVMMEPISTISAQENVVINTDTRLLDSEIAYQQLSDFLRSSKLMERNTLIYKKIDSTMRGNIGTEIDAIYDYIIPDFVFIVPGHPANGRQIINGYHMLNRRILQDTELSEDPTHPIRTSNIKELISSQSQQTIHHFYAEDLDIGDAEFIAKLKELKRDRIAYVTFDCVCENDLEKIARLIKKQPYTYFCVGSAGLLGHLPKEFGYNKQPQLPKLKKTNIPKLFVIGSMSQLGRRQLDKLVQEAGVKAIEIDFFSKEQAEEDWIVSEVSEGLAKEKHIVLYSSADRQKSKTFSEEHGRTMAEVGELIAENLGTHTHRILNKFSIETLFLTGGETAQKVLKKIGINRLLLLDELEKGVPVCGIESNEDMRVVTKAGNFGSEEIMVKVLNNL